MTGGQPEPQSDPEFSSSSAVTPDLPIEDSKPPGLMFHALFAVWPTFANCLTASDGRNFVRANKQAMTKKDKLVHIFWNELPGLPRVVNPVGMFLSTSEEPTDSQPLSHDESVENPVESSADASAEMSSASATESSLFNHLPALVPANFMTPREISATSSTQGMVPLFHSTQSHVPGGTSGAADEAGGSASAAAAKSSARVPNLRILGQKLDANKAEGDGGGAGANPDEIKNEETEVDWSRQVKSVVIPQDSHWIDGSMDIATRYPKVKSVWSIVKPKKSSTKIPYREKVKASSSGFFSSVRAGISSSDETSESDAEEEHPTYVTRKFELANLPGARLSLRFHPYGVVLSERQETCAIYLRVFVQTRVRLTFRLWVGTEARVFTHAFDPVKTTWGDRDFGKAPPRPLLAPVAIGVEILEVGEGPFPVHSLAMSPDFRRSVRVDINRAKKLCKWCRRGDGLLSQPFHLPIEAQNHLAQPGEDRQQVADLALQRPSQAPQDGDPEFQLLWYPRGSTTDPLRPWWSCDSPCFYLRVDPRAGPVPVMVTFTSRAVVDKSGSQCSSPILSPRANSSPSVASIKELIEASAELEEEPKISSSSEDGAEKKFILEHDDRKRRKLEQDRFDLLENGVTKVTMPWPTKVNPGSGSEGWCGPVPYLGKVGASMSVQLDWPLLSGTRLTQ